MIGIGKREFLDMPTEAQEAALMAQIRRMRRLLKLVRLKRGTPPGTDFGERIRQEIETVDIS